MAADIPKLRITRQLAVTPGAYSRSRPRRGMDGEVVQEAFGEVLRAMYADLQGQPLPTRLVALVRRLDGGRIESEL